MLNTSHKVAWMGGEEDETVITSSGVNIGQMFFRSYMIRQQLAQTAKVLVASSVGFNAVRSSLYVVVYISETGHLRM